MKKRLLSLVLALALCLGLTVPALAANTSGLDANGAKAYLEVLNQQIATHGIITDTYAPSGIMYTALEDMNADGTPELILFVGTQGNGGDILVWTLRNGKAVQTVNAIGEIDLSGNIIYTFVSLARKPGEIAVCVRVDVRQYHTDGSSGLYTEEYRIYHFDGTTETLAASDKTWTLDNEDFVGDGSGAWYGDEGVSTRAVLSALTAKAFPAPAAGTYGPYTITGVAYDGSPYTVSFSAAKVEQKTVQVRECDDIGDGYSPYENETAILVTIRSDTEVMVSGGDDCGVPVQVGYYDGNNQYTKSVFGVAQYIHNGIGKKSFEWDLIPDYVQLENYLIMEDTNAPSTGGFTDVKSGAYYEDAVKWAVDKKITSGTSAMTFSPDQTCTVAQIITFLWKANGSPEPTGRNPFSDISASDYFYKAAIWAYEKELIPNTGSFRLNSGAPCTRSMVAFFLWKLAGAPTSVSSSQYAPQTITVVNDGEYYLKFSAAAIEDTTITKRVPIYADDGNYTVGEQDMPAKVTLVTMYPGSTVTVTNTLPSEWNMSNVIRGYAYTVGADGKYYDMAWDIPLDMYTGAVENAFQYSIGDILVDHEIPTALQQISFGENSNVSQTYMLQMASAPTKFSDVSAHAAYAQAVVWAVEKGITSGTSATTFSPAATCTRGQIVAFLHRAMG